MGQIKLVDSELICPTAQYSRGRWEGGRAAGKQASRQLGSHSKGGAGFSKERISSGVANCSGTNFSNFSARAIPCLILLRRSCGRVLPGSVRETCMILSP